MSEGTNLYPGLIETTLEKPYRKNLLFANRTYRELSVKNLYVLEHMDKGWKEPPKGLGTHRTRLRKDKPHHEMWNHKVWSVFAQMNFHELNEISKDSKEFRLKQIHQIDVFAKFEDTVTLVECKSKEELGKAPIRKILLEIGGYKDRAISEIQQIYSKKTKVGFVLATRNYIISDNDVQLANDLGIVLFDESIIEYFTDICKTTGTVSKYQLLSEVYSDVEFPHLVTSVPCLKTKIGNHDAYMFTIKPEKLIPISFIAHRAKGEASDMSAFQRLVKGNRLKQIRTYIEGEEKGFFPTNILVNIDTNGKGAKFLPTADLGDITFGTLSLPGKYKTVWVIDGQHRLLAYEESYLKSEQNLSVLAFYDMDPIIQANMFVDINNKQRRVPPGVIIELNAKLKWGSKKPREFIQALNATCMLELATIKSSSLHGLVKLEGDKDKKKPFSGKTIEEVFRTQRFFGTEMNGALSQGPFWVVSSDEELSKTKSKDKLVKFIDLLVRKFNTDCNTWNNDCTNDEGRFVLTNNGFSAIVMAVNVMIKEAERNHNLSAQNNTSYEIYSWIEPYLDTLIHYLNNCGIEKLKTFRERQGKAGQGQNKILLLGKILEKHEDFRPPRLVEDLEEISEQWTDQSGKLVKKIELAIKNYCVAYLKDLHPNGEDWLYEGVPTKFIGEITTRKAQNKTKLEESFDLKHWKAIIENSSNWHSMKPIFAIKQNKQQTSKAQLLSWFDKMMKIRNKTAHANSVTEPEYQLLRSFWEKLEPKLESANDEISV